MPFRSKPRKFAKKPSKKAAAFLDQAYTPLDRPKKDRRPLSDKHTGDDLTDEEAEKLMAWLEQSEE